MKISMHVEFKILEHGVPLTKKELKSIFLGGYYFVIDRIEIPFDWDDVSGTELNGIFSFDTGVSSFGNNFELSNCYDDEYERLGVSRKNISAQLLSSVSKINDFHINFVNSDDEEIDLYYNDDDKYKIQLVKVSFIDVDSEIEFNVDKYVLDNFNL